MIEINLYVNIDSEDGDGGVLGNWNNNDLSADGLCIVERNSHGRER